jgi:hypothetical protein
MHLLVHIYTWAAWGILKGWVEHDTGLTQPEPSNAALAVALHMQGWAVPPTGTMQAGQQLRKHIRVQVQRGQLLLVGS